MNKSNREQSSGHTKQPILIIVNKGDGNVFAEYLLEILAVEGILCYEIRPAGDVPLTKDELLCFEVVILGNVDLEKTDQDVIRQYVHSGGRLIASKPPCSLDNLFGVKRATGVVKGCMDGYITLNPDHSLTGSIIAETLQFHWQADLYEPCDAQVFAYFGGSPGVCTHYPAIVTREDGTSRVAMFAYDIAASTVYFHQGLPYQSSLSVRPDPDLDYAYKPNDLFVGYLDERLKLIPQADVHQDIFVTLLRWLCEDRLAFPRVWHFPHGAPSMALLSGDSDAMTREQIDFVLKTVEVVGGKYTIYLTTRGPLYADAAHSCREEWATMYDHFDFFSREEIAGMRQKGHDLGPHLFAGRRPSLEMLETAFSEGTRLFNDILGWEPAVHRGHNAIWVGWSETAELLSTNGIRLDTNFMPGPPFQYGYLNGSALPVKFASETGAIIDCYEQSTVFSDDGLRSDKLLQPALDAEALCALSEKLIDDCRSKYHGVFHPCFHPAMATQEPEGAWIDVVVSCLSENEVPFVNATEWLAFNDARRSVVFGDWRIKDSALSFSLQNEIGIDGLTLLFPRTYKGSNAEQVVINGALKPLQYLHLEGMEQVGVILSLQPGEKVWLNVVYVPSQNGQMSE